MYSKDDRRVHLIPVLLSFVVCLIAQSYYQGEDSRRHDTTLSYSSLDIKFLTATSYLTGEFTVEAFYELYKMLRYSIMP